MVSIAAYNIIIINVVSLVNDKNCVAIQLVTSYITLSFEARTFEI